MFKQIHVLGHPPAVVISDLLVQSFVLSRKLVVTTLDITFRIVLRLDNLLGLNVFTTFDVWVKAIDGGIVHDVRHCIGNLAVLCGQGLPFFCDTRSAIDEMVAVTKHLIHDLFKFLNLRKPLTRDFC